MLTLKKTFLNEEHKKTGARLVEFNGFEMPLQYQGIISEHKAVREHAGIFDVSHMGEFLISGKDALNYLNHLVPNDIRKIEEPGIGLYTQICNEQGGTIDDLIIYKLDREFLVVVNAGNIKKDWDWFNKNKNNFDVELKDISDKTSLIALQGPQSESLLSKALDINTDILKEQKYFHIKKHQTDWIARTGYTGEDGFEIFVEDPKSAVTIWQKLTYIGAVLCGLGARDTLRLEAAYPLYGHELDDNTSPLEAGLGWTVKLDKKDNFIGKEILTQQKHAGLSKKLICLKINDKAIARQGHKVFTKDGTQIGYICSGSHGITVGYPIATAYIPPTYIEINEELCINIREKLVSATIVQRPFYKRQQP